MGKGGQTSASSWQSFGWRLATAAGEALSDAEVRAMMEKERQRSSGDGGGGGRDFEDDIVVADERSLATLSTTELLNHQVHERLARQVPDTRAPIQLTKFRARVCSRVHAQDIFLKRTPV